MEMEEKRFEPVSADASFTTAMQAGHVRKGMYLMIKQRPCKVIDTTKFQPGKHGHAKCHFVGRDVFDEQKMEATHTQGHAVDVPIVTKTDYQVINISADGYVGLLDLKTFTTRAGLKLPMAPLATLIRRAFEAYREQDDAAEVCVVVLKACGNEIIVDVKMMAGEAA